MFKPGDLVRVKRGKSRDQLHEYMSYPFEDAIYKVRYVGTGGWFGLAITYSTPEQSRKPQRCQNSFMVDDFESAKTKSCYTANDGKEINV